MDRQTYFAYLLIITLMLCTHGFSRAEREDSAAAFQKTAFKASLRSIQIDGTFFLFTMGYGGSVDLDFLHLKGKQPLTLGVRGGVERFSHGSLGGETGGSPFLDYNVLVRSTIPGELLRVDLFAGYAHHTSDHPQFYPAQDVVKYGAEVRLKIAPGIFGLLAKASWTKEIGAGGIGMYCGWDQ